MSASDLVPRVVFFVTNLERENAELKLQLKEQESQLQEQEDKQLLVQITGPNRTPIYYEGSLKNGEASPQRTEWCHFDEDDEGNTNNHDILLPLSVFTDSEIWLNGILIETFQDVKKLFSALGHRRIQIHPGTGVTGRGITQPRTLGVQGRSPVTCIDASVIGSITDIEFSNLTSEQFYCNLEQLIALHDDLNLKINFIVFRKKNISGAMSLLEKMGIHTSDNE